MHIKCQKQLNSVGRLRGGFGFSFFFWGGKRRLGKLQKFLDIATKAAQIAGTGTHAVVS